MSAFEYGKGDATEYQGPIDSLQVIAHCVNDAGKWGKGFVLPLGVRYPISKTSYLLWRTGGLSRVLTTEVDGGWTGTFDHDGIQRRVWASSPTLALGHVLMVEAFSAFEPRLVAHLCGQHGIRSAWNAKPIRYDALEAACQSMIRLMKSSPHQWREQYVQSPMMGSGLAGGSWEVIANMLTRTIVSAGVRLQVFEQ